jgi:serine/threonine protein kinase
VIASCLGTGGMGAVYKAIDKFRQEHGDIDCHVAIKVLHEGTHEQPAALARLRCEFYCAQMLSHPNVVNVFELDRDGELDFFTMEWLDGELLSSVLQQFAGRPMPRAAAWAIIRQIAEGIAHAHERNIVHADLKPQNIMLTQSGQVRILDFGASSGGPRGIDAELAQTNKLALTPAYASCELLSGKRPDPRDDVYALSCLACELLAGQHPFWHQRSTAARMALAVPSRPPNLSDRQWRALKQGLAWDREHRSISVRDWLAILNPQGFELNSIPRPQRVDTAPRPRPKFSAVLTVAAFGLLLACLSAWALFSRPARMSPTATAESAPAASSEMPQSTASPPVAAASGESWPMGLQPEAGPSTPTPSMATPSNAQSQASASGASATAASATAPPPSPPKAAVEGYRAARTAAVTHAARAIDLASASYRIPRGANFAEVRVRRTSAADRSTFEWWTEESTALSGVDYVAQPPAKVTFPRGSRTASLFVKLLEDSARKRGAKFDVVIGGASKGTLVRLSRAQIVLAPGAAAPGTPTTPPIS